MTEKHTIMGGKVHVYKRENSTVWQCSSYMEDSNRRVSTKETSLAKAKEFAEDWYLELHGKMGLSQVTSGAVQDYRIFRLQNDSKYKAPARSTMHQEIVTLRQVLKTAIPVQSFHVMM